MCEKSLGECFVLTCVWCSCVFIISSGWGVSSPGGIACCFHLHVLLTLSLDGGVNARYNRLSIWFANPRTGSKT